MPVGIRYGSSLEWAMRSCPLRYESFVEILVLSIDMEKTISVIIEKIEIDTKIASIIY